MGRVQTFETEVAVRAAREVFWRRGYEEASIPELEAATGLRRSSLYNTFGSKRGLFDAAVRSYLDEVVTPRLRPMTGETVDPDAVVDYLRGVRSGLLDAQTVASKHGCLLMNAAGAPVSQEHAVGAAVADYREELRSALASGLAARRPDAGADELRRTAEAVTALVTSALALTRVDNAAALRSLDTALELVA
ncbi:TetR/AcrR family transcriptional regulator [Zhihengliuella halotolerans]|uniref:TetR/AcrR family transcriptional regulator n=1 Tax=Zhihengliuella halotolerans TaxID=370736 RepID=UPI000C800452|nr:TetR/AcrR family transcriptional regulator [Zhihengliuella halotolerans]